MSKHLVIDLRWVRDTNLDGIARYSIEVAKGLLLQNNQQFKITFLFDKEDVRQMVQDFLPKKTYNSHMVPFPVLSIKELLLLPRILRQLNTDIFFSPNYLTFPFNGKTKTILVIHDLTQYVSPETLESNLKWQIFFKFKFQTKFILNKVDKIVTVSKHTKKDIIRLFKVKGKKISVIYPGVDKRFFIKVNNDKLQKVKNYYQVPSDFILSVSRQDSRKNLPNLIRAYDRLSVETKKTYKLVIAGSKHPRFYPKLETLVKNLNLQENVLFTDYISENDLPVLYQLSQLVVYPSFYEGFGLPVLEAMASGVPVVTSSTSSLPEVAGDATVMVDPHSTNGITSAMEKVLNSTSIQNNMIEKGFRQAKKFNWETTSRELQKVFFSL